MHEQERAAGPGGPADGQPRAAGKLHVDVDDPPKQMAALMQGIRESSDPTANFALFEQAGMLQAAEPEKVDGETVTSYEGTVDLATATPKLPDLQRQGMQALVDEGYETAEFTLSVDEQDRLREVHLEALGPGVESVVTVATYSDYGTDTQIVAPPRRTWREP